MEHILGRVVVETCCAEGSGGQEKRGEDTSGAPKDALGTREHRSVGKVFLLWNESYARTLLDQGKVKRKEKERERERERERELFFAFCWDFCADNFLLLLLLLFFCCF